LPLPVQQPAEGRFNGKKIKDYHYSTRINKHKQAAKMSQKNEKWSKSVKEFAYQKRIA
jgi:hypothetical protein